MKYKSYVFVFIFFLIIPMVSARDRVSFYIDADSWIEDNGVDNLSRFTIKLYPKDDGRNVDIEDEKEYIFENKSHINNESLIIRFDSSATCTDDDIINNITNICQKRTEELENARKGVEDNKQVCDKDLASCNTEKTKWSDYESIKTNYNTCASDKNACIIDRDKYKKTNDNLWFYIAGSILGGIALDYFIDIRKIFKGGKKSSEMKETSQSLQGEF